MRDVNVKQAVLEFVQKLPDDCTWDDVMYRVYVRQQIDEGIRDVEQRRMSSHDQVVAEFLDSSA